MKRLLQSNTNKIILLVLISVVVFVIWHIGLETVYIKTLTGVSNFTIRMFEDNTRIELTKESGVYHFDIYTYMQGREITYPQEIGSSMQPFIIILSWQIFLFFVQNRKRAFRSLGINFLIYLTVQVFYLFMLTDFYTSGFAKFMFQLMMDSFYIVAVILVIKDYMIYNFRKRLSQA
ncbi:MAG: hypothetical protein K9G67_14875 [Bacteroidales bacterium]|nr:hypothetical protein [Bacteroidales bacterium]MCF8345068.1 hypothetical protein [Bacteroidales bacterium]MCF8377636.1 hypothetical protein [Bacteroidales bacterium]MCF8402020.1 hypothetical protein [Bacteroidales bacterium]